MMLNKTLILILATLSGTFTKTNNPYRSFFGVQPHESFDPNQRHSSYPYISSDTFRSICDHIIDETNVPFEPRNVKDGDLIYVRGYPICLNNFIKELPQIKSKFILVTHNSDDTLPGKYAFLLEHSNLIAWFTQNKGPENHPKLHALPIGIACNYWYYGDSGLLTDILANARPLNKKHFLYVNFKASNNPQARDHVVEYFRSLPFCSWSELKPWNEYLYDLGDSIFVLSPPGNGLDCYRAWEALLFGAIPVMISTSIDCLFDDLPVVIVKDWHEITPTFLSAKYQEIQKKQYNFNKIYAWYWIGLIKAIQKNALS